MFLQKNSVQKFDILKNAFLLVTAPLYIAENNQEQIANLDAAISNYTQTHSGLFTLPSPSRKNLKKKYTYKKHVKNLRDLFQTVHS